MKKKGGRIRKKQLGGLLKGKSHKYGGIPAIIDGKEPVELEGGEYVIRESSVQKYGEGTIARINQGLVDPNKLRRLKNGGPVNGRNNMVKRRKPGYRKGGPVRKPMRKFQQGGHAHYAPHIRHHKHPVEAPSQYGHWTGQANPVTQQGNFGANYDGSNISTTQMMSTTGLSSPAGLDPSHPAYYTPNSGPHGHGSSTINPNPRGGGRTRPTLNRSGGRQKNMMSRKLASGRRRIQYGGSMARPITRLNNNKKYRGLNVHLQSEIRKSKLEIQNSNPGSNLSITGNQATTPANLMKQGGRVTGKR